MRIIDVKPSADAWTVRSEDLANDLIFHSGRAAEQAALDFADRLAKVGVASEIRIHLKDGSLGGRFFSPAVGPSSGRVSGAAADAAQALEPT